MLIAHAMLAHHPFHLVDKRRQETLGFRHRQRAGREGDAGHRVFALRGDGIHQAMIPRELLDPRLLIFRYAGDNQVLVSGDAEFALMDLSNLQQASLQRTTRIIENAAVFNKQRQVPLIINPLHPADAIAAAGKFVRADRLKLNACPALHFRLKGFDANALKGVLGFRILTVGTVTPVALGSHDRFRHRQSMLQRQITEFARRAGVGFFVTVFYGKTAAHQQVKAHQLAVFGDRHKVHVVGVQIDIVLRRDHHRGFKLTRQIGLTEDRLFVSGGDLFLIQPDLGIGAGARQQMLGDLFRPLVGLSVQLRLVRVGGAQHVTVHIVGGGQRVQPHRVQHLMHRLDVLFQNAVKLESLPVGQANTAVNGVLGGKLIDRLPLGGGDHPARQTAAEQHRMTRLQLLGGALRADIAIVLLVHTVETDQQEVIAFKTAGQTVV